ncbi:MAG: hypothetical protein MZV64_23805 [Ignavibacteriales bacterium]|nr:hypothetical protein [Ignavibacteriales bacterium]
MGRGPRAGRSAAPPAAAPRRSRARSSRRLPGSARGPTPARGWASMQPLASATARVQCELRLEIRGGRLRRAAAGAPARGRRSPGPRNACGA